MAVSTVTHPQDRAGERPVKGKSGFSLKAWLFGAAEWVEEEPEPFAPDAQSRWLLAAIGAEMNRGFKALAAAHAPEKPQPVQGEAALYNTHPKPLLRRLAHLAIDLEADPTLGYRDCVARLHEVMDEFSAGARDEFEAQKLWEKRTGEGRQAAERKAQRLLATAADDGEDAELKTATVVTADGSQLEYLPGTASKIVASALRASDPTPTALQVAMTPGVLRRIDGGECPDAVAASVTATAVLPSPVRGDAPPVPTGDVLADTGAHEPLPHRTAPLDVLPASETDQYALVDPTAEDAELGYGSWIWDEGCGTTGPVWLKLARRHVEVHEDGGDVARLDFANHMHREVKAGEQVRVLDPQRARDLLAQHEQELAARAAERAA